MHAEPINDDLPRMTEAEYLAFADEQEFKHEYSDGHVYAMTGGSVRHGVITASTSTHINNQLGERDCSVTSSDVRVFIAHKQTYRYPDVTVFCDDPIYREGRTDTLTNPVLLVEVLSPSTTGIDHTDKLAEYTRLDSLQAYLLISQDEPKVEVYQRHTEGQWLYYYVTGLEAEIVIPMSGGEITLLLSQLYRRVRWNDPETSE